MTLLDQPPTVGKFYMVPAIGFHGPHWMKSWYGHAVPVIGVLHDDAEIIKLDKPHYHIDWRFVSDRTIKRALGGRDIRYIFSLTTAYRDIWHPTDSPVLVRRQCRREWPEWPRCSAPWLEPLEQAYKDHRLGPKLICPHKGIPLASCRAVNGIVTCPGHGLRWNLQTGQLVPTDWPKLREEAARNVADNAANKD